MNRSWLVRRALLAVALMVGFYTLALAIVAALLWVPYAEVTYLHRVHLKLTLACVAGAGAIVWALLPRRDHFEPPGPRLDPAHHPKLFALVADVAHATDQRKPDDVYLVNDVNAWVTERGGVMGIGARRVMGVGLPLLQALSIHEFRAVLAHEFGHYSAGDVKLGPWIHKTRAMIGRTITAMGDSALQAPFLWYGKMFLKLTHAVSRQQEYVADAVAAGVSGAATQAAALRRVMAASAGFSRYMAFEVMPVLRAGYIPPLAGGFAQFMTTPAVEADLDALLSRIASERDSDPFDTHPCLRDRLAALGEPVTAIPRGFSRPPCDVAAVSLMDDADAAARLLLEHLHGQENVEKLRPISWDTVGEAVYAPGWLAFAARQAKWLVRFTADAMPNSREELTRLGSELVGRQEHDVDANERLGRAVHTLATGLACVLLERGWKAETAPGRPVELVNGSERIEPWTIVQQLAAGALTREQWAALCQQFGIAGVRLLPSAAIALPGATAG